MAGAGAFIAALITEIKVKNLNTLERTAIQTGSNALDQTDLFPKTEAMAGVVFGITGVVVIVGLAALVLRIFNTGRTKSYYRIFFCLVCSYIAPHQLNLRKRGC